MDNIEGILNNLPPDYDLYTQQHVNHDWRWRNTEYYGIKKELYFEFANTCGYNMESHFYNFCNEKKILEIPHQFKNNIARSDGHIITNL